MKDYSNIKDVCISVESNINGVKFKFIEQNQKITVSEIFTKLYGFDITVVENPLELDSRESDEGFPLQFSYFAGVYVRVHLSPIVTIRVGLDDDEYEEGKEHKAINSRLQKIVKAIDEALLEYKEINYIVPLNLTEADLERES